MEGNTYRRGYQRCRRIDYGDSRNAFLVTVCVKPRRHVFIGEDRNEMLVSEIKSLQTEGSWGVYLYCIMPDHVHLIVNPGAEGLSKAVGLLKGRYAKWWRSNGDGQRLWQKGFSDHRIRHGEGFGEKCQYVLQNPVRAGLVKKTAEYRWSGSLAVRLG